MRPGIAFAALAASICFTISAALAGQGEQDNINFLARKDDGWLKRVATMAGDMNAVMQRCRLKPTEDGKAIMAVPILLYDGIGKRMAPDPRKFQKAIHAYERAFAIAVQRAGDCKTEKARYPRFYQ